MVQDDSTRKIKAWWLRQRLHHSTTHVERSFCLGRAKRRVAELFALLTAMLEDLAEVNMWGLGNSWRFTSPWLWALWLLRANLSTNPVHATSTSGQSGQALCWVGWTKIGG